MSWGGDTIKSHVLKKSDVHVDALETGGLVPIERLIHATTELSDVPGVDADVAFCKGPYRLDPCCGCAHHLSIPPQRPTAAAKQQQFRCLVYSGSSACQADMSAGSVTFV